MTWHRFLISLPFTLFLFLEFLGLGWLGAGGKFVKRNVLIAIFGGIVIGIMFVLSGCQKHTSTPVVRPAVEAGVDAGAQDEDDDDNWYYEFFMESTMEY